jgi:hypothetical protein
MPTLEAGYTYAVVPCLPEQIACNEEESIYGLPFGMQLLGYDSDTVMPTVIITDDEGKIIFADLTDNYRVRPEPETFMRVLSGAGS